MKHPNYKLIDMDEKLEVILKDLARKIGKAMLGGVGFKKNLYQVIKI